MEKEQHPAYKVENEYCPACLIGRIIVRNGPYSDFLACDRYPRCNFISNAKPSLSSSKELEREADKWLEDNKNNKFKKNGKKT